jgi:beta-lactamase regulating signal transducer with metallopeptidase domain
MQDLLDASVRSLVVALAVGLLLAVMRVRSSALRHLAWLAVVVAMLSMPVLTRLTPSLLVVSPPAFISSMKTPVVAAPEQRRSIPQTVSTVRGAVQTAARMPSAPSPLSMPPAAVDARSLTLTNLVTGLYAVVCGILILRLGLALSAMARLRRGARPVDAQRPGWGDVLESPSVVAPVTIGFFFPRIVLPPAWRTWSRDKLDAVLAHERTHIRRRDPLAILLARLNRCVFWFHPLAWWLERALSRHAEVACDREALRTAISPRRYAELLLEVAEAVRRAGGRMAAPGVGVLGEGEFRQRIDLILRGGSGRATPAQVIVVVAVGVMAVGLVAGCREPSAPPALRANPATDVPALSWERARKVTAADALTPSQVEALEATWQQRQDDVELIEQLFLVYRPDRLGKPESDATRRAASRRVLLALIRHHPEHDFFKWLDAHVFAAPPMWIPDREGMAEAERLWLAHTQRPDVTGDVVGHAALFLRGAEFSFGPRAALIQQLLERAHTMDPSPMWTRELGRLYGSTVRAALQAETGLVQSLTIGDAARQDYEARVRPALEATRDAPLLTATAAELTMFPARPTYPIGRAYIDRALEIDPKNIEARQAWERIESRPVADDIDRVLHRPFEPAAATIARMPRDRRLRAAIQLAWQISTAGVRFRPQSKEYATLAIDLAAKDPYDPYGPDAVFDAHIILGLHALTESNRRGALRHLKDAGDVPRSRVMTVTPASREWLQRNLVQRLLQAGEHAAVVSYFEQLAANSGPADRPRILRAASDLRRGYEPVKYTRGSGLDIEATN